MLAGLVARNLILQQVQNLFFNFEFVARQLLQFVDQLREVILCQKSLGSCFFEVDLSFVKNRSEAIDFLVEVNCLAFGDLN